MQITDNFHGVKNHKTEAHTNNWRSFQLGSNTCEI